MRLSSGQTMNTFKGTIAEIKSFDSFRLLQMTVNGMSVQAVTLELDDRFSVNTPVRVLVKESDVVIAKNRTGMLSIENRYCGVVTEITPGEIFSEIAIDTPLGPMTAIIGRNAQDYMKLVPGDSVNVFVRANEIAIMEDK